MADLRPVETLLTADQIGARVAEVGDLFLPVLAGDQDLPAG